MAPLMKKKSNTARLMHMLSQKKQHKSQDQIDLGLKEILETLFDVHFPGGKEPSTVNNADGSKKYTTASNATWASCNWLI